MADARNDKRPEFDHLVKLLLIGDSGAWFLVQRAVRTSAHVLNQPPRALAGARGLHRTEPLKGERVASGEVAFEFCRSVDNASDCFTKALAPGLFQPCLRAMSMLE